MIERRPFEQLGGGDHGWLKARHHFSFAEYYDPRRTDGVGILLVWNHDEILPGTGFPPHMRDPRLARASSSIHFVCDPPRQLSRTV